MEISEKIKNARHKKGISQRELGVKTGISLGAIQGYEQGRYKPKIEQLVKLSAALDVSINDLDSDTYSKLTSDEKNLFDALNHLWQNNISEQDLNILNRFINSEQYREIEEIEKEMGNFCPVRENKFRTNKLFSYFDQLNQYGQNKLMTYAEDLTKIPEYRKDTEE